MRKPTVYEGLNNAPHGGMDDTGNIIRDAWVFELIPETETCEGWTLQRINGLYEQVSEAWSQYAHIPSRLPPELLERHQRIYAEAIKRAKAAGWDPDEELEDEI